MIFCFKCKFTYKFFGDIQKSALAKAEAGFVFDEPSIGLHPLDVQALHYRFYGNLNEHECIRDGNRLVYRNHDCRVQTARSRKGLPYHPCKSVGSYEYSGFAATIDDRIKCRCLSCYPDCTESPDGCAWEFYLEEE